ncbi:hypothetical protein DFH11DRAFT_1728596 [Phellopilus nigrolimitatus]|nr:hypothetical protein DFH11DRAFT_1728596 [Phellopilus nigrolimitatus]
MYTLCTTLESVEQAVQVLSQAEYMILDCEGRELGCTTGAISLICLGTPHAQDIYILDMLSLAQDAHTLLFDTILSPSENVKRKVVWDGRMDYTESFFTYGKPLENCLDLQLVDIASRAARGERNERRLRRISRFDFPSQQAMKLQLAGVHVLNSMDRALKEHCVYGVPEKSNVVKDLHMNGFSDMWMTRPLREALLKYAADDIKRIAALYDRLLANGHLGPAKLPLLLNNLLAMYRCTGKQVSSPNTTDTGKECTGCKRVFSVIHFPYEAKVGEVRNGQYYGRTDVPTLQTCKVCTLILAREQYSKGARD